MTVITNCYWCFPLYIANFFILGGIWNRHVLKASRMNPITWMNLVAYQNKKICICIVLHCPFAFINKTVGCHHSSKFHFKETKKISNPFIVRNKLNTLIRLSFLILCRSHIFIFLLSFFFQILSLFTLSLYLLLELRLQVIF